MDVRVLMFNPETGEVMRLRYDENIMNEFKKKGFEFISAYGKNRPLKFKIIYCKFHNKYEIFYHTCGKSLLRDFLFDVLNITKDCRALAWLVCEKELNIVNTDVAIRKSNYKKLLYLFKKLNDTNNLDIIYFIFLENNIYKKTHKYIRKVKNIDDVDVNVLRKFVDELINQLLESDEFFYSIRYSTWYFYKLYELKLGDKYIDKFAQKFNANFDKIMEKFDTEDSDAFLSQKEKEEILKQLAELTKHPLLLKYLL